MKPKLKKEKEKIVWYIWFIVGISCMVGSNYFFNKNNILVGMMVMYGLFILLLCIHDITKPKEVRCEIKQFVMDTKEFDKMIKEDRKKWNKNLTL